MNFFLDNILYTETQNPSEVGVGAFQQGFTLHELHEIINNLKFYSVYIDAQSSYYYDNGSGNLDGSSDAYTDTLVNTGTIEIDYPDYILKPTGYETFNIFKSFGVIKSLFNPQASLGDPLYHQGNAVLKRALYMSISDNTTAIQTYDITLEINFGIQIRKYQNLYYPSVTVNLTSATSSLSLVDVSMTGEPWILEGDCWNTEDDWYWAPVVSGSRSPVPVSIFGKTYNVYTANSDFTKLPAYEEWATKELALCSISNLTVNLEETFYP